MKTLSSLKVLVVEDEALVSMLVEDMLTDLGCAIVGPAAEIEEALRLAGSADIDAALLDVNLGGRPIFPVADARAMTSTFPDARLHVVAGAGLFAHEEAPEQVAAAILETVLGER